MSIRDITLNCPKKCESSVDDLFAEHALNLAGVLEIGALDCDNISSWDRTHAWVNIEKYGRLVIVEYILIVSVLRTIQGQFYARLVVIVAWRWNARSAGWVFYFCSHSDLQINKSTPAVRWVVNLVKDVFEWVKVSTDYINFGSSWLRTAFRIQFLYSGPVVVPIVNFFCGVLLAVETQWEWHCLFDDVGKGRKTLQISVIFNVSDHGFGTNGASRHLAKSFEVFAENLNRCWAIFGAVARKNLFDDWWSIVNIRQRV